MMKAVVMAFGNNCNDICGCVQGLLKEKKAIFLSSGQDVVGGRPCFAVIADFGSGDSLKGLQECLKAQGVEQGLEIKVVRPDMFLAMHRIIAKTLEPISGKSCLVLVFLPLPAHTQTVLQPSAVRMRLGASSSIRIPPTV